MRFRCLAWINLGACQPELYFVYTARKFITKWSILRASLLFLQFLTASMLCSTNSSAMQFSFIGLENGEYLILGSGIIESGDNFQLQVLLDELVASGAHEFDRYKIEMDSIGGSLSEALLIGRVLNKFGVATIIRGNAQCLSACAIAYLGGTLNYAVAQGTGRFLEEGAKLGFHGFSAKDDRVVVANETLKVARIFNGLIGEYTNELDSIDFGWLSVALTFSEDKFRFVNRFEDIFALGIELENFKRPLPNDWYFNACTAVTNSILTKYTQWENEGRILSEAKVIASIAEIRNRLQSVRFSKNKDVLRALKDLPDILAIDIIVGQDTGIAAERPILEAVSVPLERGAGFYYDDCITLRSKNSIWVMILDDVFRRVKYSRFDLNVGFDQGAELWSVN